MVVMTEEKREGIQKFANESPCVCFNIRKASRAITQIYDGMFKGIGLKASQVAILNSLRMIGPMTILQLAEAMATDRTTITRNLKPLERDNYIKIHPGEDRREREVVLTQKGQNITAKTMDIFKAFQEKVYKLVGKERLDRLCQELAETMDKIQKI